tara:strand:- start:37 stop:837 length:801 start_codon:yes stop_codon:yes gene_type:complete
MASIPPQRLTVDKIVSDLLEPATTSFYQVSISDPRQLNERGDTFATYLRQQGLEVLFNARGLDPTRREKLQLFCSETTLPGSSLATANLDNDFTGVSEKYAHRRVFDEEISLTFYCDAKEYLPVRYFESWLSYMTNDTRDNHSENFYYRMKFPKKYKGGLEITKFEKNLFSQDPVRGRTRPLTYTFIDAFPKSISAMPVTYDASDLLKCSVSFSYTRYSAKPANHDAFDPSFAYAAGQFANIAVDRLTGVDLLGDIVGGVVQRALR